MGREAGRRPTAGRPRVLIPAHRQTRQCGSNRMRKVQEKGPSTVDATTWHLAGRTTHEMEGGCCCLPQGWWWVVVVVGGGVAERRCNVVVLKKFGAPCRWAFRVRAAPNQEHGMGHGFGWVVVGGEWQFWPTEKIRFGQYEKPEFGRCCVGFFALPIGTQRSSAEATGSCRNRRLRCSNRPRSGPCAEQPDSMGGQG